MCTLCFTVMKLEGQCRNLLGYNHQRPEQENENDFTVNTIEDDKLVNK